MPEQKSSLDGVEFNHHGQKTTLDSLKQFSGAATAAGPALQNLKDKLSSPATSLALSHLAESLAKVSLASPEWDPTNPDWDPKDHPKDAKGKFVKKGHGTYLFGKVKQAIFTLEGKQHSLDLEPGTTATMVTKTNGKQWVVTNDAHGNYVAHESAAGHLQSKPVGADSNIANAVNPAKETPAHLTPKVIATSPATEIQASDEKTAAYKLNSTDGKPIVDVGGGQKIWLEHNQKAWAVKHGTKAVTVVTTDGVVDDLYDSDGTLNSDPSQDDWQKLLTATGLLIADGAEGATAAPTHHDVPEKAADAPIGSVYTHASGTSYTKTGPDKWLASDSDQEFTDANIQHGWADALTPGSKNKATVPPVEKPKAGPAETGGGTSTFTHPLSGDTALNVTEVHQHKTSTNSYLVKTQSGGWLFFDKNGKVKNASQQIHLKYLGTNYKKLQGDGGLSAQFEAHKASKAKLAHELPVGSTFTTKGGNTYEKTAHNEWTAQVSGNKFSDAAMDSAIPNHPEGVSEKTAYPTVTAQTPIGTAFVDPSGNVLKKVGAPGKWEFTKHDGSKTLLTTIGANGALSAGGWQEATAEILGPPPPKDKGTFDLPNGEKVDLKPGTTVFETGGNYAIFYPDGTGKKVYNHGGTSVYVGKKDSYKGWNVVADVPPPKLTAPDLKDVKPDTVLDKPGAAHAYLASRIQKLQSMTGGYFNYAHKITVAKTDSPFANHADPGATVSLLASDEFRELVDSAAATLAVVGKTNSHLDKQDKMAMGKNRSRFEFLGTVSRFAKKLQDLDADPDEIEAEWASISQKLHAKHNTTFGSDFGVPNTLGPKLAKAVQSWKFKQGIKDIGFDPDTASLETLQEYASKEGFPAVGGLTAETAKTWTKVHLGDPSIDGDKAALEKSLVDGAHLKIAAAASAIFLKKLEEKPDPKKQAAYDKAIEAQQKALITQAKNLNPLYEDSVGHTLAKVDSDTWTLLTDTGTETITSAQALEKVQEGGWKPTGLKDIPEKVAALNAELGGSIDALSASQLNAAIKERGGSYLGKMATEDKKRWLRAHVAGDGAYAYWLEHQAAAKSNVGAGVEHKDHATHPGSWGSPQGKAYRQTLADFLAQQPWYENMQQGKAINEDDIDSAWNSLRLDRTAYILGYSPTAESKHFSAHQKKLLLDQFLMTRGGLPKASFAPEDLKLAHTDTTAPTGIDQEAWNVVLAAEKGAPEATALGEKTSAENFSPYTVGTNSATAAFVPDTVKKLALWAASGDGNSMALNQQKKKILDAIKQRVADQAYIPADVPVWKDTNGTSWPLAPGSKVLAPEAYPGYHVIVSPDGTATQVSQYGSVTALSDSTKESLLAGGSKVVYGLPDTATLGQAKADGLNVDQFTWDSVDSYEKKAPGDVALPGIGQNEPTLLYEIKNGKGAPPELKANADKLPLQVKMLAAWAAAEGDQATLDTINYKLKKGHYTGLQAKALFDPDTPYGQKILHGHVSGEAIFGNWGTPAMEAFDKQFGTKSPTTPGSMGHAQQIAHKIHELFNPEDEVQLASPESISVLPKDLQLTPLAKSLGGMHSKSAWTDQEGNEWMSKAFPSDPNSKARVDAEHQANVIGRLFGFRNPETRVMTLKGQYSYVQHLKPATGSLSGKGPNQLSDESLAQAMEEHVLDWLVSNHDSHPENLLTDPDGKSIIGIDKGQAWRFFPKDKLAVGYKATNPVAVWYDQFYKAVQNGQIDKKRADHVTRRVLQKALRVQEKFDADFKKALEEAHKNRTVWPSEHPTRESFIDAVVARKKNIANDFHDFYAGLYKQAGWDFSDFDLEKLQGGTKFAEHVHTGLSPEYAEAVQKGFAHGKAVILSSEDLEDSHFLFYTEKGKDGSEVLRGEARLRQNADAMLTAWLKQQTIANNYQGNSMNVPAQPNHAQLPGNQHWWSSILAAAKTVNHHSSDGEYNQGTLATMEQTKQQMQKSLADLQAWEAKNPDKPHSPMSAPGFSGKFVTKEQQDAWKDMLESYLKDIESIEAAKAKQGKVVPHVSEVSYSPSKGLDTKNFIPGKAAKKDNADEVVSNVVMVAGHPVKVTKHPAYGTSGTFDHKTGVLTEKGTTTTGFYGAQYDIEVNGIKIEYRPWSEPGVLASQKGLLKVRADGWDGTPEKMELAFDILRDIGLELDNADETSMELFYWKQQYGVSLDRLDNDGKYKAMQDHVKSAFAANPDMSPEEQLATMREAWAKAIGKDKVDKADWTPKFDRMSVASAAGGQGKPYWLRPDYTLADYKQMSATPPASSSGDSSTTLKIAMSGYLPTEERARIITEIYAPGGYNSQQADAKNGASGFVFTRQNKGTDFGQVYYHPSVALRTTNYAFNGDKFGDTALRKTQSPADLKHSTKYKGGGNELMIKNGIGYTSIAAIRFPNSSLRDQAIAHYKQHGVTTIHGIPIEELFVTNSSQVQQALKKVWDKALEEEKATADLTPHQKAAYAALIAAGKTPTEALQEAKTL